MVSVWDKTDLLLLRPRTEPPAREDATLPGLPRFAGALRRDRPWRVPESGAGTSKELVGSESRAEPLHLVFPRTLSLPPYLLPFPSLSVFVAI